MRQTTEEISEEFRRLKSKEEIEIKENTEALAETVKRNAQLDEEEASRAGKRMKVTDEYTYETPEAALKVGDVKWYY